MQTIKTVQQFLDELEKVTPPKDRELFFRGEAKDRGEKANKASIFREKKWIENEHKMYREFILRNPNEFTNDMTTFDKLVKMQHYDLPTRLLDVSSNALMSLYFACEKYDKEEDGVVTVFEVPKDNIEFFDSKKVSIISNIAVSEPESLKHMLSKSSYERYINYASYFVKHQLYIEEIEARFKNTEFENTEFKKSRELAGISDKSIEKSLSILDRQVKGFIESSNIKREHFNTSGIDIYKNIGDTVLVKPLLSNKRIVMQSGAFIIFGASKEDNTKLKPSKLFYKTTQIKIDKSSKNTILRQLEKLGISKDRVYPEMDKVADYVKKMEF
jgi:hypothetical protein